MPQTPPQRGPLSGHTSPPRRAHTQASLANSNNRSGGHNNSSTNTNNNNNSNSAAKSAAELSVEEDAFGLMEYIGAEGSNPRGTQLSAAHANEHPPLSRMTSPASFRAEPRSGLGLNRVTAVYDQAWGDAVGGDGSRGSPGGLPSSCVCGGQLGATRRLAVIQSRVKAALVALADELAVTLDWSADPVSSSRSASSAGFVTASPAVETSEADSATNPSAGGGTSHPVVVPLPQGLERCLTSFVEALVNAPPAPPSQPETGTSARFRPNIADCGDSVSSLSIVRPQPPGTNSSASPLTSSRPHLASFGRRHSSTAATEPPSSLSGPGVSHLVATTPASAGARSVDVSVAAERTLPPAFAEDEINGTRSNSANLESNLPTPVAQWFGDAPPHVDGADESGSTENGTPRGQSTRTLPPMPMPPRGTVCAQVVRSYSESVDEARAKTIAAITPLVRLVSAIAAGTLAPPPPMTLDDRSASAASTSFRPRATSDVDFNVSSMSALAAAAAADRRRSSAFVASARVLHQPHHRASVQAAGIPQATASNRPLAGEPPALPPVPSSPAPSHLAANAAPLFSLMASPVCDPTRAVATGSGFIGVAGTGTGSSGSRRRKTQARIEAAMIMSLRDAPATAANARIPCDDVAALPQQHNTDYNSSVASLGHLPTAGHTTSATIGASHDAAGLMADDGGAFTVNQYLLLCELGAGKQGRVFLAEDTLCGMARAVKVIPRPGGQRQRAIEQAQMQSNGSGPPSMTASPSNAGSALAVARAMRHRGLQREVSVMKKCRHKNIVALYEVIDDPNDDRMYLVMQYVEQGPLASLSPDGCVSRTFSAADLAGIARQLCAGLEYLHRKGVAHRDIKPDNILRDRDGTVYLSDFGMAELLESDSANPSSARQGIHGTRGTIAFMAPELFDASSTELVAGEPVDVWALGISFYALLFGRVPWERPSAEGDGPAAEGTARSSQQQRTRSITDQICAFNAADSIPAQLTADDNGNFIVDRFGTAVPATDLPPELYPRWRDLLVAMLTLDPGARVTANELRKRVLALDALAASLNTLSPVGSTTVASTDGDSAAQMAESVTQRW